MEQLSINTIRTLAMDAVQAAKSGHPGAPMGLAPVAYALWQHTLCYDPDAPRWPNRDRFVLSNGHASMLLYAMLHLAGIRENGGLAVTLDDIKQFRQLGSRTPGHPEYGVTTGVETTTGPLGQGVATSVGMAIAERWLAAHFNRPGFELFTYNVYALCSDGDMMEGVSSEAASLAGHLGLGNLCWIYDNNHITIDGSTELTFTEDVPARFAAYGWDVQHVTDANDVGALRQALRAFAESSDPRRPMLIVVDSHIGYGAPAKQDTAAAHGEPLGPDQVKAAKQAYGWPDEAQFLVPNGVPEHFAAGFGARGRAQHAAWEETLRDYRAEYPDLGTELDLLLQRELPSGWDQDLPTFSSDKALATRDASGAVLNAIGKRVPWLLGGAADLATSNKTRLSFLEDGDLRADNPGGRNIHFGIREHAMSAAVNGLALSGLRPFGATFLIFSDYARPAIRLSALMELPSTFVYTHDSIGVGEDGPTHQPIEQLASLRAMPGLVVIRPADANEVIEAWRVVMSRKDRPKALALTRQPVPTIDRNRYAPASGLARGAYVLADSQGGEPEVLLIATGSEVALCLEAHEKLADEGIRSRVVSMPSWELFEEQDQAYRDAVLPPDITARISVEQAATTGWERYVGPKGTSLGMSTFGASGPLQDVQQHFGFTVEHVVAAAHGLLGRYSREARDADAEPTP
jgi:transketolase